MSIRLGVLMLIVLTLVGCTGTPQYAASYRAPILGVVADENLRVVEVVPGGAAEESGLRVGDVLLDLAWIPTGTLEPLVTMIPFATLDPFVTVIPSPTPDPSATAIPFPTLDPSVTVIPFATQDPSVTVIPVATVIALAEAEGFIALDANGMPIEGSESLSPIAIPAATIPPEQYMERATVPFTDSVRISSLAGSGFPLKLRLQREGEILEMTIIANYDPFHALTLSEVTPTPVPDTFYVY